MRYLAPQVVALLVVVGSACCTPPKPHVNTAGATTYICQWSNIEVTQGISVVTEGDPKKKSVKELADKGLAFRLKQERIMDCQATEPPKELKKAPPNIIRTPAPKKQKPSIKYINNGHEI